GALQSGHGSDAVENSARGRSTPCLKTLQSGHGSDAVENGYGESRPGRRREPFNPATAATPWRTIPPNSLRGRLCRLQSGHGSDAAQNPATRDSSLSRCVTFNPATAATPWRTTCPVT